MPRETRYAREGEGRPVQEGLLVDRRGDKCRGVTTVTSATARSMAAMTPAAFAGSSRPGTGGPAKGRERTGSPVAATAAPRPGRGSRTPGCPKAGGAGRRSRRRARCRGDGVQALRRDLGADTRGFAATDGDGRGHPVRLDLRRQPQLVEPARRRRSRAAVPIRSSAAPVRGRRRRTRAPCVRRASGTRCSRRG